MAKESSIKGLGYHSHSDRTLFPVYIINKYVCMYIRMHAGTHVCMLFLKEGFSHTVTINKMLIFHQVKHSTVITDVLSWLTWLMLLGVGEDAQHHWTLSLLCQCTSCRFSIPDQTPWPRPLWCRHTSTCSHDSSLQFPGLFYTLTPAIQIVLVQTLVYTGNVQPVKCTNCEHQKAY